jgi:TolB-like protein
MPNIRKSTMRILGVSALLVAAACASSTTTKYVHPNMDLGAIKRVAVLPFETLVPDRSAGEKVQKIFLTELLSLDVFDVAEPGQVAKVLKAERIDSTESLGPADLKRIADALKVQGLFLGTVVDYAESRTGATPSPDVTIQLRLVEAQTGVTVWSASRSRSGATASARLFGVGGQSLTQVSRQLMQEELSTLVK